MVVLECWKILSGHRGLSAVETEEFTQLLCYQKAYLLFTYLGIPLISGRFTIKDCLPLTEKQSSRVTNWKNHNLSYTGRIELIKYALPYFLLYWARSFVLPKIILKDINNLVSRFSWEGSSLKKKLHHANIKRIRKPKSDGERGLMDVVTWNKAPMCGLILKLVTNDSPWSNWVYDNHLKTSGLSWSLLTYLGAGETY